MASSCCPSPPSADRIHLSPCIPPLVPPLPCPALPCRMVNGLLKTVQGVPPGADSTLQPSQDAQLRLAAIRCLVSVLRSMGQWTNKQLCVPAGPRLFPALALESNGTAAAVAANGVPAAAGVVTGAPGAGAAAATADLLSGDALLPDLAGPAAQMVGGATSGAAAGAVVPGAEEGGEDSNSTALVPVTAGSELSEAAILEQRRAYKLELQEGITLFNKKPQKGLDFLIKAKKVGESPEAIVQFLKNTSGLNKSVIGDFLGERADNSIRVMHAYMDSFQLTVRALCYAALQYNTVQCTNRGITEEGRCGSKLQVLDVLSVTGLSPCVDKNTACMSVPMSDALAGIPCRNTPFTRLYVNWTTQVCPAIIET